MSLMTRTTCLISDCGYVRHARGLCASHYLKWWKDKDGELSEFVLDVLPRSGPCKVVDCERRTEKEFCAGHQLRIKRYGDPRAGTPLVRARRPSGICSIEDCNESYLGEGLCHIHLNNLRLRGDPLLYFVPKAIDEAWVAESHQDGRTVTSLAKEIGVKPKRIKKVLESRGIPIRAGAWGKNHPRWKGGRVEVGGYVRIVLDPDDPFRLSENYHGSIFEHRYVMAKALGRSLQPQETVHHLDGDRGNNRLENLQLRSGPHGEGILLRCVDCGSHNILSKEL